MANRPHHLFVTGVTIATPMGRQYSYIVINKYTPIIPYVSSGGVRDRLHTQLRNEIHFMGGVEGETTNSLAVLITP